MATCKVKGWVSIGAIIRIAVLAMKSVIGCGLGLVMKALLAGKA